MARGDLREDGAHARLDAVRQAARGVAPAVDVAPEDRVLGGDGVQQRAAEDEDGLVGGDVVVARHGGERPHRRDVLALEDGALRQRVARAEDLGGLLAALDRGEAAVHLRPARPEPGVGEERGEDADGDRGEEEELLFHGRTVTRSDGRTVGWSHGRTVHSLISPAFRRRK